MTFIIPSGLISIYNAQSDALIDFWHRNIILVYPELQTACINCITNTMPGVLSSTGRYRLGGPQPFSSLNTCPWCDGKGYTYTEQTEIIPMIVRTNIKSFSNYGIQLDVPAGSIETRFLASYLPKIQQCQEIRYSQDTQNILLNRYNKLSDPNYYGLNNRYIIMTWKPFRGAA